MKNIKARLANAFDENLLLSWSNDPDVRLNSFNKSKISVESHKLWFKSLLSDNKKKCYIFELKNTPFGTVRFEKKTNNVVLNYLISKNFRRKGLAKSMLKLSLKKISQVWGNIDVLAYTLPDNLASKKSLESSGFNLIGEKINRNCYLYTFK